jgi:hypothetical protein
MGFDRPLIIGSWAAATTCQFWRKSPIGLTPFIFQKQQGQISVKSVHPASAEPAF